ncbi:hypothetical protein BDY21DRAFT_363045 [Lineolata rhizophorae]|uniref:Uncharacterized protein n=1 Tax=Lineolata rhizophorae TaxID=578093 RepID=A0A6A6P2J4_9PEZI|nr:hypothetical protein BDY21DRAFT_363045 [Lineolata rhizophorae]
MVRVRSSVPVTVPRRRCAYGSPVRARASSSGYARAQRVPSRLIIAVYGATSCASTTWRPVGPQLQYSNARARYGGHIECASYVVSLAGVTLHAQSSIVSRKGHRLRAPPNASGFRTLPQIDRGRGNLLEASLAGLGSRQSDRSVRRAADQYRVRVLMQTPSPRTTALPYVPVDKSPFRTSHFAYERRPDAPPAIWLAGRSTNRKRNP